MGDEDWLQGYRRACLGFKEDLEHLLENVLDEDARKKIEEKLLIVAQSLREIEKRPLNISAGL